MPSRTPPTHLLVIHFVGDVLKQTMDAPTDVAYQQALQRFLTDLSPWVVPTEVPTLLGPAFTIFEACEFTPTADGTDENISVVLSPQGIDLFRAWLRRQGVDPLCCSS
jgi:hypothetical protein